MRTGRTGPCVVTCTSESGATVELVIKLSGSRGLFPGGLLAEAFASLLATELGLPVSKPYIVYIERDFADTIPNLAIRELVLDSIGPNFGSAKWPPGYSIWLNNMPVPYGAEQLVADVFAFDALIQNPDRTPEHPNCAVRNSEVLIYDHELAFSNLRAIFGPKPWEEGGLTMMRNHLFNRDVGQLVYQLDRLHGAVSSIADRDIDEILSVIPDSWEGDMISKSSVKSYLQQCRDNFTDLRHQLQSVI